MTPLMLSALCALTVTVLVWAEVTNRRRWIYLFKPLSTVLVIMVAWLMAPSPLQGYAAGILCALTLSLAGDICLMSARSVMLKAGIYLFGLAHVCYAVVFTRCAAWHLHDIVCAAVLLAVAMVFYRQVRDRRMRLQIIGYIAVISLMVNRAVAVAVCGTVPALQRYLIVVGAVLFLVSDIMTGIARFVVPFRLNRLSLFFYYAAQLCFAFSVQ